MELFEVFRKMIIFLIMKEMLHEFLVFCVAVMNEVVVFLDGL